jgi:deoxyribonuclease-4
MAMPGKEVGGQFKDLHTIMEELGYPPRLGVCLDSCHLFSQGYALRERSGVDQLVKDLEEAVGMDRVKAVHLNDSKFPQGSAKDRHERIGLGTLGDEGIAQVINHPALCDLPFELETPVDDYQEYAVDIARVKSLRTDH